MSHSLLPLATVLIPVITGIMVFFLDESQRRLRTVLNLSGAVLNLLAALVMLVGVFQEQAFAWRWPLLAGLELYLEADAFAMLFTPLSAGLWLVTTVYAVGYMEHYHNRRRFFGFFSLCVATTMGVALAGNLLTFFVFYELLTLSTYPLVVHRGDARSLAVGTIYLRYTVGAGAVLLVGLIWVYSLAGTLEFTEGGFLAPFQEHDTSLRIIFFLLVGGFGVKAALVPLHGWLPMAMVAPAPVSALLHAVAVVKAGAFGIVRVVYDVFGVTFAHSLGVTGILAVWASLTILYGSLRALAQDDLKRRLAYSTVSQVSYIALGVSIAGPVATLGGVVHLIHQGVTKITLFFCAGNLAETLHIHKISEMDGVGRQLPLTMSAFTLGALGMIGIPPMAGFITKWYLGLGSLEAGQPWVILVLLASTLLNAAYFLPILHRVWFRPARHAPATRPAREGPLLLLLPPLITGALALLTGLFAAAPFTPLEWAVLITEREYPDGYHASP